MTALLLRQPWIDEVLRCEKKWKFRGSRTGTRGRIALIQSGTGTVVGTCDLVSVEGSISVATLRRTTSKHGVPAASFKNGLPYKKTCAWVLRGARKLRRPVPYDHPSGAEIHKMTSGSSRLRKVRGGRGRPRLAGHAAARSW
jgi:hypothetical protein